MKEELQDYIASYWNRELSNEEKQLFENRCATDEAFAREVALNRHLQHIAKENYKKQLKENYFTQQKQGRNRRILLIGGALIAIVVISFLLFKPKTETASPPPAQEPTSLTPERIYAQLKPTFNDVRNNSADNNTALLELYNNQQYDTLITLANQKDLNQPQNLDWLILKTLSSYGQGNYSQVVQDISTYQNANPNNANEEGKLLWIQALAHWKSNNISAAKNNWEMIVKEEYRPYSIQAKELLKNQ